MLSRKGTRRRSLAIFAIANACLCWLTTTHAADVPIDVFGRLPSIEDLALSPDGKRLAFVKALGEERSVVVMDIDDGKALAGVGVGISKLRSIRWADSDHLLIVSSYTGGSRGIMSLKGASSQLSIYNVRTRKVRDGLGSWKDMTVNQLSGDPMIRRDGKETYLVVPGWLDVKGRYFPTLFRGGSQVAVTRPCCRSAKTDTMTGR